MTRRLVTLLARRLARRPYIYDSSAPAMHGARAMTRHAFALVIVASGLAFVPANALARTRDQAATRAYIRADYQRMRIAASRIPLIEATLHGMLAQVRQECPMVAAGSPSDAQSIELEDEVIGAMVIAVVGLDRPAGRAFVSAAGRLRWSDRKVTRAIHSYVEKVRTLLVLPQPSLCSDIRSWAASGFATLSASTLTFTPRFMAAWVAIGELPPALVRYETPDERPLFARTRRLEARLSDLEAREVKTFSEIIKIVGLGP
jgi:hypothetical protein